MSHRLWPLPTRRWVMTQSWHDLLFAHWPIDHNVLRSKVPHAFELDVFNGTAWIGIVPFTMTHVAPRGFPALPWLSAFPELNVRTYVSTREGKPGVYFFSLDASRWLAVMAARAALTLPYFPASMRVKSSGGLVHYDSRRRGSVAAFSARYQPTGPEFTPSHGSLERFLTERYCLYNLDRFGRPSRLEIHHAPWRLQRAEAEITRNRMTEPLGIPLEGEPLLHFSKRQDAVAWLPKRL